MIPKPLAEITESDLHDLLTAGISETKTLDYKQRLPEMNDSAKREFLADVSSFANTAGGDLIFGITEQAGVPASIPGVEIANTNELILRLDNIIRTGLAPRIRHTSRAIPLANRKHVLVIRVDQSWYGPHRVTFKSDSRFYGRTSNGKYELDVTDLRNAFLLTNTITEKLEAFRSERVIALESGRSLVPLTAGPLLVMHCMPLESFRFNSVRNVIGLLSESTWLKPMGRRLPGWGARNNYEGVICVALGDPPSAYTQVYRTGVIEAVGEGFLAGWKDGFIPSTLYEGTLLEYLPICFRIVKHLECGVPIVVAITLIGVRGLKMAFDVSLQLSMGSGNPIDRDVLMLPGVIVEDLSATPEVLLKPTLDLVWNACGFVSSRNFDETGKWQGRP